MSRRYGDPVEVRRRDDVPAEFLWRGRLYVVREVLAHWIETDAWWQSRAAQAVYGEGADAVGAAVDDSGGDDAGSGVDTTAMTGVAEREVWQVEASPGRLRGPGVYDLSFDWSAGVWSLARAYD